MLVVCVGAMKGALSVCTRSRGRNKHIQLRDGLNFTTVDGVAPVEYPRIWLDDYNECKTRGPVMPRVERDGNSSIAYPAAIAPPV